MYDRLFEKSLRKKRISIENVDLIGIFVCLILAFCISIGVDIFVDAQLKTFAMQGIDPRRTVLNLIDFRFVTRVIVCYFLISAIYYSIRALKDKSHEDCKEDKSVIFIDQIGKSVFPLDLFRESRVYWFLTEPYIYRVCFMTDHFSEEPYRESYTKLHFNLPPDKSYKKMKNYDSYCVAYDEDPRKTDKMRKSNRFSSFSSKKNKNGRDWHRYTYYITYEKAQLLNEVFDRVEVPAFQVKVNEQQGRLLSIHPIEGREYPEGIPALLDKINAMYP